MASYKSALQLLPPAFHSSSRYSLMHTSRRPHFHRIIKTSSPRSARNMSVLVPRIAFAPGHCGPVRHAPVRQEITPLFSLLDDAFAQVQRASRPTRKEWRPRFDVKETAEAYHVDAELPGVEPKDVSVEFVDEHTLSIKGRSERHTEKGTRPDLAVEDAPAQESSATPASETSSVKSHQATVEDEEPSNAPATSEEAVEAAQPAETEKVQEPAKTEESPKEQYWFSERHIGSFQRQFAFPARVDQEHIKASLKNGLLSIVIPKAPAPESKRINIE